MERLDLLDLGHGSKRTVTRIKRSPGHALLHSFQAALVAVRSSPDQNLRTEAKKFCLLGDAVKGSTSKQWSPVPSLCTGEPQLLWPPWPRVEDWCIAKDRELVTVPDYMKSSTIASNIV